jgi:hypothetical protein
MTYGWIVAIGGCLAVVVGLAVWGVIEKARFKGEQ